ncbi:putative FAD binding domain protein [Rosellinia necatrix]|uniref:Putative FAD binding domain protein n=1 Tax=Rosellinia necatrix TaxID=77044 RepID=A0A1W2TKA3_ROSNE|nr:putative FAD binding domain protein [Rosellinia necatrix]
MLLSLAFLLASVAATTCGRKCKNIPGDSNWPSQDEWASLNETIGGNLIATVPLASVCHSQGAFALLNESACDILKGQWDYSEVHFEAPASIMPGWFQESCNPFSPASEPCELGDYASYSISVNSVDDVVAGIRFSRDHNVRLVIKNTGHDATGKSTGRGALSLWMKNLKSRDIIQNYQSSYYTGPAIKLGAGVLGLEAYETADAESYRIAGGNCPSVGIVGGYTQGGGHSQMGSVYGMAADNILEWEVVTADGTHLTATPSNNNSDLYWALSGGGGGTYGVVVSMTTRLHADGPIGGGYLTFDNQTVGTDTFWHAVGLFNSKLPGMLDAGNTTIAYSLASNTFGIYNIASDGRDAEEVRAILQPFLDDLESLGVPYNCTTHQSATFLEHLRRDYGPFPNGPFTTSGILGGRLIPRSVLLETSGNDDITQILRDTASGADYAILMQSLDVESPPVAQVSDNAVLPAWRQTAVQLILSAAWDWSVPRAEMARREGVVADELIPRLVQATPGSGAYLNEANMRQVDWQDAFFGPNYGRLLDIKNKYDPESLFYATQAVGSEAWAEDAQGRLCRPARAR